jgi:hypothetical protein
MNAFKLSLLFLAVIAALNLRQPETRKELKPIVLKNDSVITERGELQIPTLLKSDAPVIEKEKLGVLTLRVKGMRFIYERSSFTRNEYILRKIGISSISVKKGDKVEIDFSQSNIKTGESFKALVLVGGKS